MKITGNSGNFPENFPENLGGFFRIVRCYSAEIYGFIKVNVVKLREKFHENFRENSEIMKMCENFPRKFPGNFSENFSENRGVFTVKRNVTALKSLFLFLEK